MEPYIKIKNLNKIIKNNQILNNINLELYRGKIYGFRGINGSGKTMLFRAICGLIIPTEGEIIINNKVLHKDISFPESVGVLIEHPGFLPNYTGKGNLRLLAEISGKIGDREIEDAIKKVGLNPNDKRKYKQYSLGMKQKLGIAQAFMENPDIILLDEPTNALDEESVKNILNIIRTEKENGKLILIASHDKSTLEHISDEIFEIELGKIKG